MTGPLVLSREQVLAHRRRVGALDGRLPSGADSVRRAAWAGLTDSVPRAALLSLHARVEGTAPSAWLDPPLVQLWGPRFSTYAVASQDQAVFSLGRRSAGTSRRRLAEDLAERLENLLGDQEMPYGQAGRALGVHPNQLRYAATTGRVLIRWDGARQPVVRMAPVPTTSAEDARLELARRYLRVLGPGTADGFGRWAGLYARAAGPAFESLRPELTPVRTEAGDAWVLTEDEPDLRTTAGPTAPARLLPSGDAYYLLWGRDRELLVPETGRRAELWTSRVWPGAVLVRGEVVGTWRRAEEVVLVSLWGPLPPAGREAVEREALSLPVPRLKKPVRLQWQG